MRWGCKALIQNAVAMLPSSASYRFYYWLQRHMGELRRVNPVGGMKAGLKICDLIARQGISVSGKCFVEIGTGWRINVPITLWLLGAEQTVTVDLNPYLKEELIREDLRYFVRHRKEVEVLFPDTHAVQDRIASLLQFVTRDWALPDLLKFVHIRYLAPADAAKLPLADASVDCHISNNVLEHVRPDVIREILKEGNRVVRSGGFFVHAVDFSDHFSHQDKRIFWTNFLRFSDSQWMRIAGNRYGYVNRLRIDDFQPLYHDCAQKILCLDSQEDGRMHERLERRSIPLDPMFVNKPVGVLATKSSWIVSAPCS